MHSEVCILACAVASAFSAPVTAFFRMEQLGCPFGAGGHLQDSCELSLASSNSMDGGLPLVVHKAPITKVFVSAVNPSKDAVGAVVVPFSTSSLTTNAPPSLKAVELVRAAAAYELGSPGNIAAFTSSLYPAYVRGEAYRAAHQGVEAAAEFQKIVDHRGIS